MSIEFFEKSYADLPMESKCQIDGIRHSNWKDRCLLTSFMMWLDHPMCTKMKKGDGHGDWMELTDVKSGMHNLQRIR